MKKKIISFLCVMLALFTAFSTISVSADSNNPIKAPDVKKLTASFSSVKIEWEKYDDPEYQFLIYRSPTGKKGTWTKLATTKAGATSYTDKTVSPQKTYYYTVKSYYKAPGNNLKLISDMSGKHVVTTVLERPVFELVGNGGKGVVLKWDVAKDMTGVAIYRSMTGKAGSWTKIKVITNTKTNTYTDSNVNIGETYYYCYKVYKTVNGKNYYSQSSKAYKSTILDVSTPENLKLTATKDGVKIEYSKSLGTIGYVIYRSDSGKKGTWSRVTVTTSNNTLSFVDKNVKKGSTYYYTVKSYKTVNGVTKYSEQAKTKKVVYDTSSPKLSFTPQEITFGSYFEEIQVTLNFYNMKEDDSIRIFIDGTELTDDLINDEKALEEIALNWKFFFSVDENKTTNTRMVLNVFRLAPGSGVLRFQHSEYDNVYAELKVNCPELPFDSDVLAIYEEYYLCVENMFDACEILGEALELTDKNAVDKKVEEAKEKLLEAENCLKKAFNILEKYRKQYGSYSAFQDIEVELSDLSASLHEDISNLKNYPDESGARDWVAITHSGLKRSLKAFE